MKLCVLLSTNFQKVFGTPEAPTPKDDVVIIAQKPDCSEFLLLSNTIYDGLTQIMSVPAGFDFTYCQEWGLTINDDVVSRVILDLRKRAYPPMADYLDGIVKNDAVQIQTYIDACLAVKAKYPKMI